jgi:hypothetical protein
MVDGYPSVDGHAILSTSAQPSASLFVSKFRRRGARRQTGCSRLAERAPHRQHGGREIACDEFGLKPNDAIARAGKLAVPARVRALAPGVITAINFNDQPNDWRKEINDESEQRHLAPKRNAELTGTKRAPKASFRIGGRLTEAMSVSCEENFFV